MKVNEILSAPTIGSSRALTVYSTTVCAVVLTGTSFKSLPAIGSLNGTEHLLAGLAFGVLFFMSLAHGFNWWNDKLAGGLAQAKQSLDWANTEFEQHKEEKRQPPVREAPKLAMPVIDHEAMILTKNVKDAKLTWSRQELSSMKLRRTIQQGFHLAVPMGAAFIAGMGLIHRILG